MTRTARRVIVLGLAVAMSLSVVGAQESDQPQATFFAPLNVPLISIEVYVSDRAGRPIHPSRKKLTRAATWWRARPRRTSTL